MPKLSEKDQVQRWVSSLRLPLAATVDLSRFGRQIQQVSSFAGNVTKFGNRKDLRGD